MAAAHFSYERVDPIMTGACDMDNETYGTSTINVRKEPVLADECLQPRLGRTTPVEQVVRKDTAEPIQVTQPSRQRRGLSSYRLLDWLTAIGLLVVSAAVAFALNPGAF
jgi:hypothetical protein